jgi:hypothetical protein
VQGPDFCAGPKFDFYLKHAKVTGGYIQSKQKGLQLYSHHRDQNYR